MQLNQSDNSLKDHSKPRAFNSWQHTESIPANSAFQKCWKCVEAREKLKTWLSKRNKSLHGKTVKSSDVLCKNVSFRGISQLCFAFIFLQQLELAHTCIQVSTLQNGAKQGID